MTIFKSRFFVICMWKNRVEALDGWWYRSFYDDTGIYWALQLEKPEEYHPQDCNNFKWNAETPGSIYIYIHMYIYCIYMQKKKKIYLYVRPELGQALECWSIKSIPGRLGQPKTYQQVDSSQHQFVTKEAVLFTTNNFPPKTPNKARNKASKAGLQGKWEWITP